MKPENRLPDELQTDRVWPKGQRMNSAGEGPGAPPVGSRRQQLLEIAFNLIATRGFEGLRFGEVAAQAGINNATLCYYFPTKEDLIRGVSDFLTQRLQGQREAKQAAPATNAIDELRQLFADLRRRLLEDTSFFIVITELALRAKRDPMVNLIGEERDQFWGQRVKAILERGVAEGVFRSDLDIDAAANALMVQVKGIAHHAAMRQRPPEEIEATVATVASQVELWLTSAPQRLPGELATEPSRRPAKRKPSA